MRKIAGFTLIEVMVAVAIVGILSAIAYPSYLSYVQKTRRSDGQEKLLDLAAQMERSFFANNKYPADSDANFLLLGGRASKDGYYTVTISASSDNTYTLKAVPASGKSQAKDKDCAELTIDNTGKKASLNASSTDSTDLCWRS